MLLLTYNASNLAGHTKKVTVNALTLTLYCAGNVAGTEAFVATEAPAYTSGKAVIMATLILQVFVALTMRWRNARLNKANAVERDRLRNELGDEGLARERERLAWEDKTDRENPFFVYTK